MVPPDNSVTDCCHDVKEADKSREHVPCLPATLIEPRIEWETTFDAVPDLLMILDSDHRIVCMNKAMAESVGVEQARAIGMRCFQLMHGSDRPPAGCPHAKMTVDGQEHTAEIEEQILGRVFDVRVSPIQDQSGRVVGSVHVARDITERKQIEADLKKVGVELEHRVRQRTAELREANEKLRQEIKDRQIAEDALRRSEEMFRAIFETASDFIFIKDLSRRYTHVNAAMCRLFSMSSHKIVGLGEEDLFGEMAGKHSREVDLRVLAGEAVEEVHTRPVHGTLLTFHDIRVPLRDSAGQTMGLCGISREIAHPKHGLATSSPSDDVELPSQVMAPTLEAARLAARTDSLVLLTGESGSGKDYLAQYIHSHSDRASGPFFALNCASVPLELAESELFGHEAGAFTGARVRAKGLVELAEGGTLLLNEIGELSLQLQAKLLAFLETKSFTRVGGRKTIRVDARIIAATNRDLQTEVSAGRFRLDLFHRLNVLWIKVPPLRDRAEDLPVLASRILQTLKKEMQLPAIPEMDEAALRTLRQYSWPGNVRELRNWLERSLIMSGGKRIDSDYLSFPEPGDSGPTWTVSFPPSPSLDDVLWDLKREMVEEGLRICEGNKQAACRLLGMTRFSLRRILEKLGQSVRSGT